MFPNYSIEDDEEDMQMRTISLQEYKILMDLMVQVKKQQNSIEKMTSELKSKDKQLKEHQQAHQKEQAKCINVSNLSAVSISFDVSV